MLLYSLGMEDALCCGTVCCIATIGPKLADVSSAQQNTT